MRRAALTGWDRNSPRAPTLITSLLERLGAMSTPHRITSASDPKNKVAIEFTAEDENGVESVHTFTVRKWHYRSKAVVRAAQKWIKEQKALVGKPEDEGGREDPPTELELMVYSIRQLVGDEMADLVDDLSIGEQFEMWQTWNGNAPVTEGES